MGEVDAECTGSIGTEFLDDHVDDKEAAEFETSVGDTAQFTDC